MKTASGAITYLTHDNGGRPFKVWYKHPTVQVYQAGRGGKLLMTFRTDQFLVGMSPLNSMTEYSAGYGSEFDGNSIIARVGSDNEYIHVGSEIFKFKALAPIVKYLSPVGNNDVPYPWALDALGNVYLMVENVILKPTIALNAMPKDDQFDPYTLYYETEKEFSCEHPVTKQLIKFRYSPEPGQLFDRLAGEEDDFPEVKDWKFIGKDIFVRTVLIWGEQNGYLPLNKTIIVDRIF